MTSQKQKETAMRKDTKKIRERVIVETTNKYVGYEHYMGLDWSERNMSLGRISKHNMSKVKVTDSATSLKGLIQQIKDIKGKKILTIEETTTSQWLYVELIDYVDKIVICDPYRNRLLSDGPKTDPIDARKLTELLKAGLVKEVYHTTDEIYELRKYVSAYEDIIKMGVRMKNQLSALLRQEGKTKKTRDEVTNSVSEFIINTLESNIENYEKNREDYQKLFCKLCREKKELKRLISIPGIGEISAVKILSMVVDPRRFKKSGRYMIYCGLACHIEESGGRIYGKRTPRFNHVLKSTYKTAASAAIGGNNPINDYYEHLLKKGYAEHDARHSVARYIAQVSLGVLKGDQPYQPNLWRQMRDERLKKRNKTAQ